VVVPSVHVEQSFLDLGFPAEKLFRNPYGVDLSMFAPTAAPSDGPPTLQTRALQHSKSLNLIFQI
jgi:hypothetical protein